MASWWPWPKNGLMVMLGFRRPFTCGVDGCGHYAKPVCGNQNCCLICRLPIHLKGKEFKSMADDPFERCAPFIGLDNEQRFPAKGSTCGFTGGYLNGCPVMVWIGAKPGFRVEVHAPTDMPLDMLFDEAPYPESSRSLEGGDCVSLFEAKMLAHAWSQELNPDTNKER